MSIEACLGLEADGATMHRVNSQFPQWAAEDQRLAVCSTFAELRVWAKTAARGELNGVMQALVQRASVDGGDDIDAQAALACLLMGGATALACSLAKATSAAGFTGLYPTALIDELVAGQLFLSIREYPWRTLPNVVGNVLARTRYGAYKELGWGSQRTEKVGAWAVTEACDPGVLGFLLGREDTRASISNDLEVDVDEAEFVLARVCANAVEQELVTAENVALVMAALKVMDAEDGHVYGRKLGGVQSLRVAEVIAPDHLSPKAVQHRLRRTIQTLTEHAAAIA